MIKYLRSIRKALAGASAAVAVAVAAGVITGKPAELVVGVIAALSAGLATYLAPANENDIAEGDAAE